MVTPQCDQVLIVAGLFGDRRQGIGDMALDDLKITEIADVEVFGIDPMKGVHAVDEHSAGLSNGGWTEPSTGPVRGAEIVRNSNYIDARLRSSIRKTHKRGRDHKCWRAHTHFNLRHSGLLAHCVLSKKRNMLLYL